MSTKRLTAPILHLSCGGGGALEVECALAAVPGVRSVYVNPLTETAYIELEDTYSDERELAKAVSRAGYRIGKPRTG
jgi:copper chaperone CopZ